MISSQECIVQFKKKITLLGDIDFKTQFGGYSLSIDGVVFALVKQGTVYLRGSEAMSFYLACRPLTPFEFCKRGSAVSLNYFAVDSELWCDEVNLLKLSRSALVDAKNCRIYKQSHRRLKDLPNLGIRFETLLKEVGIHTEEQLRQTGVEQSWILMHQLNKHLGLSTLYYLQGAIMGLHHAVIPHHIREGLMAWHKEFTAHSTQSSVSGIRRLGVAL